MSYSKSLWCVLITPLFLSSCTLTNPYIDDTTLKNTDGDIMCPVTTSDFETALTCSASIKSAYLDAMGDQANLSSWTGIALIPLTAFTIGFATNGESATKISDFALGSAGLYSLSNWLSTPSQTRIFALGQKAIQCAEQVALPLYLEDDDFEYAVDLLGQINVTFAELNVELSGAKSSSLVSSIQTTLVEAESLRGKAALLLRQNKSAPSLLLSATRGINASVNSALSQNIQSLSALPGFLSSLSSLYDQNNSSFSQYIPKVNEGDEDTYSIQAGTGSVELQATESDGKESLAEKFLNLQTNMKNLETMLSILTPEVSNETFKDCGIDTSALSTPLQVTPASLTFNDVGESLSLTVSGGNGTYVFTANSDVFDINQTPAFGDNLTLSVRNSQKGNYFISIKDSAGKKISVPIVISMQTEEAKQEKDVTASEVGDPSQICVLKDELITGEERFCSDEALTGTLQTFLNNNLSDGTDLIEVDGNYGSSTRQYVLDFLNRIGKHLPQEISEVTLQAVIDYEYHKTLSQEEINKYLSTVEETLPVQEKIQLYQNRQKVLETGFISQSLPFPE